MNKVYISEYKIPDATAEYVPNALKKTRLFKFCLIYWLYLLTCANRFNICVIRENHGIMY